MLKFSKSQKNIKPCLTNVTCSFIHDVLWCENEKKQYEDIKKAKNVCFSFRGKDAKMRAMRTNWNIDLRWEKNSCNNVSTPTKNMFNIAKYLFVVFQYINILYEYFCLESKRQIAFDLM